MSNGFREFERSSDTEFTWMVDSESFLTEEVPIHVEVVSVNAS